MGPELARQLAAIVGPRMVSMPERLRIGSAALRVETWAQLPQDVKALLARIEARPTR